MSIRGHFLAGIGAAAAASVLRPAPAVAQAAFRVDVHHHLAPPQYVKAALTHSRMDPSVAAWTPERSLADMEAAGVATAILSVSNPGVYFGDAAEARSLARSSNEYGAELIHSNPGRFGMFAALPLPDIDGTLGEIAYALDTLALDGVGMFTSYGAKWLGDPFFAPVWEELNRRRAVVFTHPVINACCGSLIPFVNPRVIEFGAETARTIASFVFSGAAARYPNVRVIFSHAGGTMPFLIERFTEMGKEPAMAANVPSGVVNTLQRFYYDTAQSSNPEALGALTKLVPTSQVLFGSDFPFRTETEHVKNLHGCGFSGKQLAAIERGNASRLIARLA
jgi:predicted TIM-barrel fold metal-dependent hydrolase